MLEELLLEELLPEEELPEEELPKLLADLALRLLLDELNAPDLCLLDELEELDESDELEELEEKLPPDLANAGGVRTRTAALRNAKRNFFFLSIMLIPGLFLYLVLNARKR